MSDGYIVSEREQGCQSMEQSEIAPNMVGMSVDLAAAWAANPSNRCTSDEVLNFVRQAHQTLLDLSSPKPEADAAPEDERPKVIKGAVTERQSLSSSAHIISMLDGKPYKTLRRHLAGHGLTPEEYRQRFGLKPDYPMVARDYSERRSAMAKASGLGVKPIHKQRKRRTKD
jgi:predicted transcriptional regulator